MNNSSPPPMVVEALHKRFDDRTVLDDVSFTVGHGRVVGLLDVPPFRVPVA